MLVTVQIHSPLPGELEYGNPFKDFIFQTPPTLQLGWPCDHLFTSKMRMEMMYTHFVSFVVSFVYKFVSLLQHGSPGFPLLLPFYGLECG